LRSFNRKESDMSGLHNTFDQRAIFSWKYVITDNAFSAEAISLDGEPPISLRDEVSCDGLCYVQVIGRTAGGDLYIARVAAAPHLVSAQTFTIFLTEEQLRFALPWDCRVEGKSTEHILAMLRAHATALQPASRHQAPAPLPVATPEAQMAGDKTVEPEQHVPASLGTSSGPQRQLRPIPTTLLPAIFVAKERVQALATSLQHQAENRGADIQNAHKDRFWVRAALRVVELFSKQHRSSIPAAALSLRGQPWTYEEALSVHRSNWAALLAHNLREILERWLGSPLARSLRLVQVTPVRQRGEIQGYQIAVTLPLIA
jgi:hypothetical protein